MKRRARVKNIAARIAKALDASDATRIKDSSWGADEVRARIKTYGQRKEAMASNQLADLWIFQWRFAEEVRKETRNCVHK
jgi:hypothetical protein